VSKFTGMMNEYCGRLGFCGSVVDGKPSHVTDFFPAEGQVTANKFVEWLIQAETADQAHRISLNTNFAEELRQVFIKHMGADVVSVDELT